jgi:hypothetical protein
MDSFTYGKASRGGPSLGRKPLYVALAVVVLAGLAWAIVSVTAMGGDAAVHHVKDTVKQVDRAGDTQAQANLRAALAAATTTFMDGDSFASATASELSALEPSFDYVDSPTVSTGPTVISVRATEQAWGGAVLSSSGTCFYVRSVGGTQAYGTGDADVCTGDAAMAVTGSAP